MENIRLMMTEFFDMAFLPINLLFYIFAYALAATPTSYLVARILHRINIKKDPKAKHSALYLWENLSKKSGFLVFILDFLKGVIPCAIAYSLKTPPEIIALIGLVCVLGHCFSIWLNFSGGRGAATAAGALLFIFWPASVFGLLVFLLLIIIGFGAGRASLVAAAVGIGVLFLGTTNKLVWMIVAFMGAIILLRHKRYLKS